AGEGGGYWRVEIIEKTRSINKIKLARFQLSGENLTYRAIHRPHAKASIVVSNNGETGGVLVDGQEVLNLPSLHGSGNLHFAEVAGSQGKYTTTAMIDDAVDQAGDQLAAIPDGPR